MAEKKNDLMEWLGFANPPKFVNGPWFGWFLGRLLMVFAALILFLAASIIAKFAVTIFSGDLNSDYSHARAIRELGTAVLALFGAPFLVWRTLIASKQAHTAEQGLYTDRIAKAVEQIGADKVVKRQRTDENGNLTYEKDKNGKRIFSKPVMIEETAPNLEVRIGGLYALERIAGDSPKDHMTVMEIICAYIRENCKPQIKEEEPERDDTRHNLRMWAVHGRQQPRMDVTACLTIIGRRSQKQKSLEAENDFHLDLRHTDFRLLQLEFISCENALFDNSNFQGANIHGSTLQNASFRGANLRVARIAKSFLTRADFNYTDASYASFLESDLRNSSLEHVNLDGANFRQSDVRGVYFGPVTYDQKTHLGEALLHGAALHHFIIGGSSEEYAQGFLNLPQNALELVFGDQSNLLQTDSSGTQLTAPRHWSNEELKPEEFKLAWRAWQKSIGFDPENPEGGA